MRIHEGNLAYDVEQFRDPRTQLLVHWRYKVYRLRPIEEVLASGEAESREAAVKKARAALTKLESKEKSRAA